jgi:hypothetical protein
VLLKFAQWYRAGNISTGCSRRGSKTFVGAIGIG